MTQANLPLLTDGDKAAIRAMTREFDIDFIALTYTCSGDDVLELRRFLDSMGQDAIKIIAKVHLRTQVHACLAPSLLNWVASALNLCKPDSLERLLGERSWTPRHYGSEGGSCAEWVVTAGGE